MTFLNSHLSVLKNIPPTSQGPIGSNARNWALSALPKRQEPGNGLDRKFTRQDLFEYCADSRTKNIDTLLAILAWGGMRRDHGRKLFQDCNQLSALVGKIRHNEIKSRKQVFAELQRLRNDREIPGLGIGYFTKLICFLDRKLQGYIMDQWTSKSINLLTGQDIVKISPGGWVTDANGPETYETFCSHIDQLATALECTGLEAEERIFSKGRGKGAWRNYLKRNYVKFSTK
jgi:hypothetical protein